MELTFIFYLFAAFITIPGIFFVFALYSKYLAGGIAAIGLIVFFILFGLQTFNPDGTYVQATSTLTWPPVINYCPDFLTLLKSGTTFICVDTVGVASSSVTTAIKQYNPNTTIVDNQQFNLSLAITNADTRRTAIVAECKLKNVTWQGIYDGITQYNNVVPRPPGT